MKVVVQGTESHLELIDRIVRAGSHGSTREAVLKNILWEHARYRLSGGGSYDSGGWSTLEVRKPAYGPLRYEHVLQPVTGKAVEVRRGEVLRIVQLEGGQCVDFNAYNLHDYKEYLNNGFNRMKGLFSGKGTVVWSGSPRARPMYLIAECADTCEQYYAGHRCNATMIEKEFGFLDHPTCQDTFAEAIREYRLTPDDVHDSYNFWMSTQIDAKGRRFIPWNRGRKGDAVDLLALFDTLSVPIICGSDIYPTNSHRPTSIGLEVYAASAETLELVDRLQERFGRYKSQLTPDAFKVKDIQAERKLRRDPEYHCDFLTAPRAIEFAVDLSPEEETVVAGLVATEAYGPREKVLISAFCRWYILNRSTDRYSKLSIT